MCNRRPFARSYPRARRSTSAWRCETLEPRLLLSTAYLVTDLGNMSGTSINEAGQVAGFVSPFDDERTQPVLWSNGRIIPIGPADIDFGQADAVNNSGVVVGYAAVHSLRAEGFYEPRYFGFVYQNGSFHTLRDLPGGIDTRAHAINNHGVIVGEASDAAGTHAVIFGKGGVPRILPGGAQSAIAINDAGQILASNSDGTKNLLISPNGQVQDLLALAKGVGYTFHAVGLNNHGDVIARTDNGPSYLISHGTLTVVPSIAKPGTDVSGINDVGQIVGGAVSDGPPVMYQNGVLRELSLSVDPSLSPELGEAKAITNRGLILDTIVTASGLHSVILRPVPAGSIAGTIFRDDNADGARQRSERGLAGRTVYIDASNDGTLDGNEQSTITQPGGGYSFANLAPGHYVIREVLPIGRQTSPAAARVVDLRIGQRVTGQDFGVTGPTIGWKVVDLGTIAPSDSSDITGDPPQSFATAINDAGQVVGTSNASPLSGQDFFRTHAFLYSGRKMIDLTPTSATNSSAGGINHKGQVVGEVDTPETDGRDELGFLYSGGKLQWLPTPAGMGSAGSAINDAGVIVGQWITPAESYVGPTLTAVRFRGGSGGPVLAELNDFGDASPVAINNEGDLAGSSYTGGFKGSPVFSLGEIVLHGKAILFGEPQPPFFVYGQQSSNGEILALNDRADALGTLNDVPFLFSGGATRSLNRLRDATGALLTRARGLNNAGEIVGEGTATNHVSKIDGLTHALVVLNGQLVDPNFALVNGGGWVIQSAAAVNNKGWIAGNGVNPKGQTHAILLVPADSAT